MDLITVVIVLVIVGAVLYLLTTYVPLDPAVKTVIQVVVVLALCIWLLRLVGPALNLRVP